RGSQGSAGSFKVGRGVDHEQPHALARDGEDVHHTGREKAGLAGFDVEFLLADLDMGRAFEEVGHLLDAGVEVRMRALARFDFSQDYFKVARTHGFRADQAEVPGPAVVGGRIRLHVRLANEVFHGSIQLCSPIPPSTAMVAPVTYAPKRSDSTATAIAATSAGVPKRFSAILSAIACGAANPPPGIAPGAMALTRMPCGPSARASSFTSMV